MTLKQTLAGLALALAFSISAAAQTTNPADNSTDCRQLPTRSSQTDCMRVHSQTKTIYLKNTSSQNDANEILVAIRNVVDPFTKIYLLAGQNAIVVSTYPEEMARIEALVHELDRPRKAFRLTFTLKDVENGKPTGTPQHVTVALLDGQRVTLKQGVKVPVLTGSFSNGGDDSKTGAGVQTQFTYLDVGSNFDITLNSTKASAILKFRMEESSVADRNPNVTSQDPTIRQTVLAGTDSLALNKPTLLGSVDIPGSTRHTEIEALLEPVP